MWLSSEGLTQSLFRKVSAKNKRITLKLSADDLPFFLNRWRTCQPLALITKTGQAYPRLLMFCWPSSAQTGNKRFEGFHPTTMNMDSRNWNRIGLQAALLVLLSLTTTSHGRTSSSNSCYARDHKGDSSDSDSEFEALYDGNMQTAVDTWISDRIWAEIQYGPIESWDTSRVTHMRNLFKDKNTFNDDISSWDVSCVTTMHGMFWQ